MRAADGTGCKCVDLVRMGQIFLLYPFILGYDESPFIRRSLKQFCFRRITTIRWA